MADNTKIQWTDATWNPWHGCKKVSPGCKFCYMYREKHRYEHDPTVVHRSTKPVFNSPLKKDEPAKIFTCSWSDFFIEEADQWRDDAWDIIRKTHRHQYQILTKRPERIAEHLPQDIQHFDHVWLGVSVESQEQADRIAYLKDWPYISFVSFEPLLGPITWREEWNDIIDWVIIGGESGNNTGPYRYRKCDINWIVDLHQQATKAGAAVFIKQLGTHLAKQMNLKHRHGGKDEQWSGDWVNTCRRAGGIRGFPPQPIAL